MNATPKGNKLSIDTIVTFLLLVFSSLFFAMSFQYAYWAGRVPGAGFIPRWTSGFCIVFCVVALIKSIKGGGLPVKEIFPNKKAAVNIGISWAAMICFALFSKTIGLLITSVVMLTLLFKLGNKWPKAVLFAVITAAACFVLFKIVLKVPVPVNKFGW